MRVNIQTDGNGTYWVDQGPYRIVTVMVVDGYKVNIRHTLAPEGGRTLPRTFDLATDAIFYGLGFVAGCLDGEKE